MQTVKILEMLNAGRIEELKAELRDEIYADALKNKPGAKKRYMAMKKYFTYVKSEREILQKPCIVEFNGKSYTSFCNSYSLVLTSEPCGSIELFTDISRYPNVVRMINYNGDKRKVDFSKVFAEAKSKGYKLVKTEFDTRKFKYAMRCNNSYFKLALVESALAIIDDGEEMTVYQSDDVRAPITIESSIGVCVVMPMNYEDNGEVIIDV